VYLVDIIGFTSPRGTAHDKQYKTQPHCKQNPFDILEMFYGDKLFFQRINHFTLKKRKT
jgi:hypothetical protein